MTDSAETRDKERTVARHLRRARLVARFHPAERAALRRVLRDKASKGGHPWHAEGLVRPHLAIDVLTLATLCLRRSHRNSNTKPAMLLGITCRRCTRLWKRAIRDAQAMHVPTRVSVDGTEHAICRGCYHSSGLPVGVKASSINARFLAVAPSWPCPHTLPEDLPEDLP